MSKVLQFHAEWCGPCKKVTPVLQQLVDEAEFVSLQRVDIEEQPTVTEYWGVTSVPTMIHLDEDDNEIARVVGAKPPTILANLLKLV